MPGSLYGKRILTTRPTHQSANWCAQLQAAGAQVDNIPMLAIKPLREASALQAIKSRILSFDQVQEAIFVSQNAVHHGVDWLEDYWPQLPQGPHYYAIGSATAKALQARGIPCEQNRGHMTSEDLLTLPSLQQVTGHRILIFCGIGGRSLIGNTLRARGARVTYCALYRRTLPPCAPDALAKYPATPDAISVHSGESLANLAHCIVQSARGQLRHAALVCPSARVAKQARALGFKHPHSAQNASDKAMLAALRSALD
ncbi:uroporphyrinogen-III synthase [Microbulbifer spongiae]|uniref:Uroporphyrinogen-III synthase n=1 Tax=Microbulbifer spongiae TaxID=2944933 RepID=A0ABY9EAA9_9GAMM|nr:uroporphyrinogen-III synthase [Microbulbifer sp. MI-G]WKD49974.1 uroporphyrinogen-III synthase [Microbulbifer sp. MI-G]